MIFTFFFPTIAKRGLLLYNLNMGLFSKLFKFKFKKQRADQTQKKLGLALSGGGAKGFAHIGVLAAFEEEGIRFDYVSGTSAGSLVGALYCAGYDCESMLSFARTIKMSEIRNSKMLLTPSKSTNLTDVVRRSVGDLEIEDLKTPFCCVATDFLTGNEVVLDKGNLALCVAASCSAPVFFDGIDLDGKHLVDGGLTNNLPADAAKKMGADVVVGVTLSNVGDVGTAGRNVFSALKASFNIAMKSTSYKGLSNSDFVIAPDMRGHRASMVSDIDLLVTAGYNAAKEVIPQIKQSLYPEKKSKKSKKEKKDGKQ